MKTKNIFAAGLMATMALVACNKVSTTTENGDGALKSVTINLANVLTKSTTANLIGAEQAVKINNFQVYFADANGNFYEAHDKENATAKVSTYVDLAGETNAANTIQRTFHYIDAAVTKVYVIGNYGVDKEYENLAALQADLDDVAIADQQESEFTNLKLFGYTDNLTRATEAEYAENGYHPESYYYDANITIAPLVSRIQIESVSYNLPVGAAEGATREYTSLKFTHFALNNYYGKAKLTSLVEDETTGKYYPSVTSDIVNTEITPSSVFGWFDGLADAWHNDKYESAVEVKEESSWTENLSLAYHFFPGEVSPQIVARFTGLKDNIEYPLYLATKGFNEAGQTDGTAINKHVGKVYKVNFVFDDEDIKNPQKCINVNVSVVNWVPVVVTPNFN